MTPISFKVDNQGVGLITQMSYAARMQMSLKVRMRVKAGTSPVVQAREVRDNLRMAVQHEGRLGELKGTIEAAV